MARVRIDTPDDARVAPYVNLKDADLRHLEGAFIAEGLLVVERLLEHAPALVRSLLVTERRYDRVAPLLERSGLDVPVFAASQAVMNALVGFSIHRGVLALAARPTPVSLDDVSRLGPTILVLERLNNHDNVGGAFRNAAAFGADAIILDPQCADPLYRRSIRVSMGTTFTVPWTRAEAWPDALVLLRNAGFTVAAMTPSEGAVDLRDFRRPQRLALVIGAEGEGISDEARSVCQVELRIEMAPGVDSLNAATASAVALYATAI